MHNEIIPPQEGYQGKSALIIGVHLLEDKNEFFQEDLDELETLLKTLKIQVKDRIIQRRQKFTPNCLLGTGKVEEIKNHAIEHGIDLIVFNHPLSPPQVRNLEKMTEKTVWDRNWVILEIFVRNAKTAQAKLQVEIAKLEYLLPRLTGAWTHFQRQKGGGVKSRGMGETQIEIDRRRAREKIHRLHKQLETIDKEKKSQRKARQNELKVALVGYTNSGKTTLMNALTNANLLAKDELFATLDTSIRTIDPSTRPKILLSDTVGFIRNLPHSLIESFKSTLSEVIEADLILHVIDASHDMYKEQMLVTDKVLHEIGAFEVPQIKVFNKMDLMDDPFFSKIMRQVYPGSIAISSLKKEDVIKLREHVYEFFKKNFLQAKLKIPHTMQSAISLVYCNCLILNSDYSDENGIIFEIKTTRPVLAKLNEYVVAIEEDMRLEEKKNYGIGA